MRVIPDMAAPYRTPISLLAALLLLLSSTPGALAAALARVGAHHCHCRTVHCPADAEPVIDTTCHCHHHHDGGAAEDDDPAGTVTEDHTHCPCCPPGPRCPVSNCCLEKAPCSVATAQPWLPTLPCLTPLSPEAPPLIPCVTLPGLIRPPRV